MARSSNSHASSEPQVPNALLKRHRTGWHSFTRAVIISCVSMAALLFFLLLLSHAL